MKLATKTLRRSAALLAVLMLGGCDGPSESGPKVYTLATVNGQALPTDVDALTQTVSGELTLHDESALTLVLVHRCNPNPPPGTGCQLYDGGRQEYHGTYSRSAGWLRIGTAEMEADIQDRRAVLTFRCMDPKTCFPGPFTVTYDFRR